MRQPILEAILVAFLSVPAGLCGAEPLLETKDIFIGGIDNIREYRIPALVTTNSGALLALCDARVEKPGDAINNIDLALKRSRDRGRTWEPMTIIADFPGQEAACDPVMVVDRETDTVWVFYDYILAEKVAGRKHEHRDARLHAITSTDEGVTWSKPTRIDKGLLQPDWEGLKAAPGAGIQTRNGHLVVPVYTSRLDGDYSQLLVSEDHGRSWRLSAGAPGPETNECQVVELADGSWLLNMRNNRGKGSRLVSTTGNGGKTWTGTRHEVNQPEPGCQGSFSRLSDKREGYQKNRVVFANPSHSSRRVNMTAKLSYDEGMTWPISKVLYSGPSAYSCLAILDDGTIGLLYENGRKSPYEKITFARFNVEWLTDGRDRLNRRD